MCPWASGFTSFWFHLSEHVKVYKMQVLFFFLILGSITLFIYKFILFILLLAVLGLHCCAWAFSSGGERGLLSVVVCRLLIAVASLVAEHGL